MPEFQEYKDVVNESKPTGVPVDTVRDGAKEVGSELTDLAKLIVKVKAGMGKTEAAAGNEDLVKAFSSVDKNFKRYFKNQKQVGDYLNKMIDPKFKMNKQEVLRMKRLTEFSKKSLKSINDSRAESDDYNKKLLDLEQRFDYKVEELTTFDEESEKYTKKHDTVIDAVWEKMANNIDLLKTDLIQDAKTTLIMGIGGPYAMLLKDILAPFWEKFQESDMFKIAKGKVLGIFGKKPEVGKATEIDKLSAIEELDKESVDLMKKQQEVNKEMDDEPLDFLTEKMESGFTSLISELKAVYGLVQTMPDDFARVLALQVKAGGDHNEIEKLIRKPLVSQKGEQTNKENSDLFTSVPVEKMGEDVNIGQPVIPSTVPETHPIEEGSLSDLISDADMMSAKCGFIQAMLEQYWDVQQDIWLEEDKFRDETRDFYIAVLKKMGTGTGEGASGMLEGLLGGGVVGLLQKFGSAIAGILPWLLKFSGILTLATVMKGDTSPTQKIFVDQMHLDQKMKHVEDAISKVDLMRENTEVYGDKLKKIDEIMNSKLTADQKSMGIMKETLPVETSDLIKNLLTKPGGPAEVDIQDVLNKGIEFKQEDIEDLIDQGIAIKYKGQKIANGNQKKRGEEGYRKKFEEMDLGSLTKLSSAIDDMKEVDFTKFGYDPESESIKKYEVSEEENRKKAKEIVDLQLEKERNLKTSKDEKLKILPQSVEKGQKDSKTLKGVSLRGDSSDMNIVNIAKL